MQPKIRSGGELMDLGTSPLVLREDGVAVATGWGSDLDARADASFPLRSTINNSWKRAPANVLAKSAATRNNVYIRSYAPRLASVAGEQHVN